MFSRNEITAFPARYSEYYSTNPDKKELDDKFRKKHGLLSKDATQYHPVYFSAANASFNTIERLRKFVDGEPTTEKMDFDSAEMTKFIKGWANKLGAIDCGITYLKDYHLYSFGGRAERYGKEVVNDHKYAIAFVVEMDREQISAAPTSSIVMESGQQYLESGEIALQVTEMIRGIGHSARAHIDGNYQVVCPLVARDAGLGEIGRMGLLMTPKYGPRVRISVVTTDLPLETDASLDEQSTIEFCRECSKCADACPSKAISKEDMKIVDGVERWQINSEACFTLWTTLGTDCGRCVSVCPYSHPNNLMHNLTRTGIKKSPLFRKAAVKLDDLFYGRIPKPAKAPEWMKVKFQKL